MINTNGTYSTYMNLLNRTLGNKALFDKYNFQTITGLKSDKYSDYGTDASSILKLENALSINQNFIDNNSKIDIELKALTTALDATTAFVNDIKSQLTNISGLDLNKIGSDYTGGEITFTDNTNIYMGETITIDGTTYTFANNAAGNNVDISGLVPGSPTYAEDVMTALQGKLPANPNFTFADGKFSFPLYTINGTSSVLNLNGVETGKVHAMTDEQNLAVKQLQAMAFNSMKALVDTLNINVNGNYLLGGGVSDRKPVEFPFQTIEDFQAYYDGVNIKYPTSSSANLSNLSFLPSKTGNLTLSLINDGENQGKITAANIGGFTNEIVSANPNTTGDLTFDATKNSINATAVGAFNALKAGDTLVVSGAAGGNDKAYTIKSISNDGKTIVVDSSTPIVSDFTITPADNVKFSTSFPIGSTIDMQNFGNTVAKQVQVTGISDDGTELYVSVDPNLFPLSTAPLTITTADWKMSTDSYYNGGALSSERRISENQSIVFDITAQDPAFEKLFRAFGTIAQGNFVDTRNPADNLGSLIDPNNTEKLVQEALKLINEGVNSKGEFRGEKNSDMQSVYSKIAVNYVAINRVQDTQKYMNVNLGNGIYNMKNVNETEAAAKALIANTNLQASYSVLQMAINTTFLNFMK